MTLRRLPAFALAALLAAPAAAQDASDASFLGTCLSVQLPGGTATVEARCVGIIAASCMNGPDGKGLDGQARCLDREAVAWTAVMEAACADLSDRAARKAESSAAALAGAQTAWAAFARAECGYAHALWGAEPFAEVASADCRLNTVARRAIQLRAQIGPEG